MKQFLSTRLLAAGIAVGAALLLVAGVQAGSSSHARTRTTRALVALRKTALGTILVDARGRTLYLFEKDRNGVSMCTGACAKYWPPLTSHGTPRAGKGVKQSLLRLVRARNGARRVSYAGHPLYTFVADKRAGQTAGEGLDNFGAEWYAVAANGHKVEQTTARAATQARAPAQAGAAAMAIRATAGNRPAP
jgi:predicted lipoprotein with Yx(FWY)xxD motif